MLLPKIFNINLIKLISSLQETGNRGSSSRTTQGNNYTIQNVGHPIKSWLSRFFIIKCQGAGSGGLIKDLFNMLG